MMLYILERFEGNLAIIECSEEHIFYQQIPRGDLPADAAEGDVLNRTSAGWQIDAEATQKRREKMRKRLQTLGLV